MAKKKAKAKKEPRPLKLVTPTVASKGTSRGVKRSPKQKPLPTMEQARNPILSACTRNLADIRATIADARAEEQAELQTAKREMMKEAAARGVDSYAYKENGVELLLVPGDCKLRVRALKDGGDIADHDAPIIQATPAVADDQVEPEVETEF